MHLVGCSHCQELSPWQLYRCRMCGENHGTVGQNYKKHSDIYPAQQMLCLKIILFWQGFDVTWCTTKTWFLILGSPVRLQTCSGQSVLSICLFIFIECEHRLWCSSYKTTQLVENTQHMLSFKATHSALAFNPSISWPLPCILLIPALESPASSYRRRHPPSSGRWSLESSVHVSVRKWSLR